MLHGFSSVLSAVLLLYFGYGTVNPSGKLAETFPRKLSDTPAYLSFPGERETSVYTEGVFVGYRYYDTKEADVLFPFGHGLSYTTFAHSDLRLSHSIVREGEDMQVTVTVKNTGAVAGKETVQLYVTPPKSERHRPVRKLKGFAKVSLQPGESKDVQFTLDKRSLAYSGINYSVLEVAIRRIQQDFDFLMRYLPKLPDDSYAKTETLKILKQHKAYMAQFEELLNDEKIA